MKLNRDELLLFLDCSSSTHKKTRAFAHSISNNVKEYTYIDYKFTTSLWCDILDMLARKPKELLNRADPKYQKEIRGKNLDDEGWLHVLVNNPCLIKAPLAIMNKRAVFCLNPKDVFKLVREKVPDY